MCAPAFETAIRNVAVVVEKVVAAGIIQV